MVPEINLLPKIERKQSSNVVLILAFVLFGILVLFLSMQLFSLKKDISVLSSEETQLVGQRDVLVAQVSASAQKEQGTLASSVTFVESISYPVSPLIDEVHRLLLENTYLRDYQFGEKAVDLVVDFETMNDLSLFVENLLNSTYFTDVQVQSISTFEPSLTTEDTADSTKTDFDVQSRYSATFTLIMDQAYLSAGGARP
ncbi:PilN domain-containing protein [Psychrobacillus antarcticus]|uniref:PilN domain-containing protein n=1 Tax=Psychrobacillus antarcticus TaxID=2879115 RepID=UPI002407DB10|nr:PilN domain-containing protein [Psychrobacillus antarcticus]